MKMTPNSLVLLALIPLVASAAETPRACTVKELEEIRLTTAMVTGTLLATGVVQSTGALGGCIISDATGYSLIYCRSDAIPTPGTIIEALCVKSYPLDHDKFLCLFKWTAIGSAPVAPSLKLNLGALDEQVHDLHSVTVEGTVVDVIRDEIDSNFHILLLKDGATTLPCFVEQPTLPCDLQDARVRLTGIYHRLVNGLRRFSGPYIDVMSDISVLATAPADLMDAPAIDPYDFMTPKDIAKMDRRSLVGTVLATWGGNRAMLRGGDAVVNVIFAGNAPLPPCGATVKVSGYPGTDLYRLVLSKCVWAAADAPDGEPAEDKAEDVSPSRILLNARHMPQIDSKYHGRLIRLRGVVHALPKEYDADRRLLVESDGFRVPVDFSSNPSAADGVALGCEVEVTGRCLMESGNWQPYEVMPQISGFAVVLRSPADLRVLAYPPWWTPQRLLIVIAALFAALVGFFIWNRVLNRIVERRSRALFKEQVSHVSADLRTKERTRLAIELHDSISQNLTGVTLGIKAARTTARNDLETALGHLDIAERSLTSCHTELRNCLWDLRHGTLESMDMNEAIRQVLRPQVGDIDLVVRFNVPRRRLTDNTAYSILKIIRELAVNAVHHGRATALRVAGALERDRVLFSVSDNGCGFDPKTVPGPEQGHFGLLGITERVNSFEGSISIESAPGRGTRIALSLKTPLTKEEQPI